MSKFRNPFYFYFLIKVYLAIDTVSNGFLVLPVTRPSNVVVGNQEWNGENQEWNRSETWVKRDELKDIMSPRVTVEGTAALRACVWSLASSAGQRRRTAAWISLELMLGLLLLPLFFLFLLFCLPHLLLLILPLLLLLLLLLVTLGALGHGLLAPLLGHFPTFWNFSCYWQQFSVWEISLYSPQSNYLKSVMQNTVCCCLLMIGCTFPNWPQKKICYDFPPELTVTNLSGTEKATDWANSKWERNFKVKCVTQRTSV